MKQSEAFPHDGIARSLGQLSQVDHQTSEAFGYAGFTLLFELTCILGVHGAGDKKYYLI